MDTLRGTFDPDAISDRSWDAPEEESVEPANRRDLPPESIGRDERRMQVRAYNHWSSLLGERMFPNIEDLDPARLPDFGPCSVLLDFSLGIDDPLVRFVGEKLALECRADGQITRLSDVPPRSLLSRITDHFMQILANQAPIGFEAEFVNHRSVAILYRGILLPFSSDNETIDFIYGVINWKELADQLTADELLLEIDQALELEAELEVDESHPLRAADPVTDWADSPAHEADEMGTKTGGADFAPASTGDYTAEFDKDFGDDFAKVAAHDGAQADSAPLPDFDHYGLDADDEEYDEDEGEGEGAGYNFASLADYIEAPVKKAIDPAALAFEPFDADYSDAENRPVEDEGAPAMGEDLPINADLHDWLASARELARNADTTEDRSRNSLYAAVSRAYDFSLAAEAAPDDYAELIAASGLTVQGRAPMTPVVKLVFGQDYDKTRLTEYAAVLSHAHRLKLDRGSLGGFLAETEGGLKAVVKAERRLRREEQGKPAEPAAALRAQLAQQLRALAAITLADLDGAGPEFALALIRRDESGCAQLLAEIPEDIAQIDRAARKLFG